MTDPSVAAGYNQYQYQYPAGYDTSAYAQQLASYQQFYIQSGYTPELASTYAYAALAQYAAQAQAQAQVAVLPVPPPLSGAAPNVDPTAGASLDTTVDEPVAMYVH